MTSQSIEPAATLLSELDRAVTAPAADRPHVMQQEQTSSPSPTAPAPRLWYWPSTRAWAAYLCTLLIALGLSLWDAAHSRSPDTHPLQTDRLWLRIIGIVFIVVYFAIVGTVVFRGWRMAARLRNGLCPTCGADVGDSTDRCPECSSQLARSYFGGPMYCHGCQYDLCASDGRCPECGRPFERADPSSYARYPLPARQVLGIKVMDACDQ